MYGAIEDLQFGLEDVLEQLEAYALSCYHRPDARSVRILVERGILDGYGTLSEVANEAMFLWRTGRKPPWVDPDLWDVW